MSSRADLTPPSENAGRTPMKSEEPRVRIRRSVRRVVFAIEALSVLAVLGCKPAIAPKTAVQTGEPWFPEEPNYPSPCSTLAAEKTDSNGFLAAADESSPDTKRIQDALDACAPGHSVRLVGENGADAFLSGPLDMPDGVTLWVD